MPKNEPGVMEFNRNQFFMIGLVVLFLGLELRAIESVQLTAEASEFLAKRLQAKEDPAADFTTALFASPPPVARRVVRPPQWLGWMLLSVGGVVILHSLVMPKPGG